MATEEWTHCMQCGERLAGTARFYKRCGIAIAEVAPPPSSRLMSRQQYEPRPAVRSNVLASNVTALAQQGRAAEIHGPSAGAHLGAIGSLAALVAFLIPWVSCGPSSASGMDIASGSGGSSGSLVLLVLPLAAAGLLGLAGMRYAIRTRHGDQQLRDQQLMVGLGGSLLSVLVVAYTLYQRAQLPLGSGAFVKIEPGLWLEVSGFVVATLGGFVGYNDDG